LTTARCSVKGPDGQLGHELAITIGERLLELPARLLAVSVELDDRRYDPGRLSARFRER
jgi:hypothetical protein